jgi:hypothetical protein
MLEIAGAMPNKEAVIKAMHGDKLIASIMRYTSAELNMCTSKLVK